MTADPQKARGAMWRALHNQGVFDIHPELVDVYALLAMSAGTSTQIEDVEAAYLTWATRAGVETSAQPYDTALPGMFYPERDAVREAAKALS